jgi:hypothetical protein
MRGRNAAAMIKNANQLVGAFQTQSGAGGTPG